MENVMAVYFLIYVIVGLVIYHSIFDVWCFNFGKALIAELFGACIFGALMTGLTLKHWVIALIIVILVGLALSAKVQNPTGKKIVMGVFVVVAILTAITGIRFNHQLKENEAQEDVQYDEDDYDEMTDWEDVEDINVNTSNDEYYYDDTNQFGEEQYNSDDTEDEYYDEEISYEDVNDYDYILPYSSSTLLTEEDLESLSAQELTYARNEIYARHGYVFNSDELNNYFSDMPWYVQDTSYDGSLEGVEQKNAAFISEYQTQNGLEYKPQ